MPSKNRIDKDTTREALADDANPLGIESIEYVTAKPQARGQVLEQMGFRPTGRHRSLPPAGSVSAFGGRRALRTAIDIDDFGRETITRAADILRRSAPRPGQMPLRAH
jgi:hypothetical protein